MCYLDRNEVSSALNRLVEVFQACSARIQPEHPLRSVAKSLKRAMNGSCCQAEGNYNDMAFMPDVMDNAMFALNNFGNSALGLDYLGGHNNLLSYPREFHSGFLDLQNL